MGRKVAKINDQCINCGMCCDVCPCKAIKEGGECWLDEKNVENKPESDEHYYVIKRKCIGCGRCKKVCPIANIELEEE
jgi:formate hydrogenlyase subunit 6/NADH:ubiquinone oxidoreductase subunit I